MLVWVEYYHDKGTVSTTRAKQTPQEQQEGRQINTDLLSLKEVTRAMAQKQTRTPFRSSPLTMVLREHFLTGKGDDWFQYTATIDTLKYGNLIGVAGGPSKFCI